MALNTSDDFILADARKSLRQEIYLGAMACDGGIKCNGQGKI